VADNELAARANWDDDLLRTELQELDFAGFDLDLIGFDPDRLAAILAGLGSSGLTDPDSVPKSPLSRSRAAAICGSWGITGWAAATAPIPRMWRKCWRGRSPSS
jgi:hypothetical protein